MMLSDVIIPQSFPNVVAPTGHQRISNCAKSRQWPRKTLEGLPRFKDPRSGDHSSEKTYFDNFANLATIIAR